MKDNNNNKMKNINKSKMNNNNNNTKTSLEVLPSKVTSLGVFGFFKKMITEVLLVLALYPILFIICWQFRHLIKIMADVEDILNDEFLMMLLIHQKKLLSSIKNEKN